MLFIEFPTWLRPEVIPGLPFRWYGLMYIVAFAITYILLAYQVNRNPDGLIHDTKNNYKKKGKKKEGFNKELLQSFFFWVIFGGIIGGRLAAVTIYDTRGYYLQYPLRIFWPFENGTFIGLQGMSYHGGLVGVIVTAIIFMYRKKFDMLKWFDMLAAFTPLGYTFGRLGNFINGELYGRVSTRAWGVLFPAAAPLSTSESWVHDVAQQVGIEIGANDRFVNLPRHPSQLYEAFFEGIFLWALLWFIVYPLRRFKGAVFAAYLIGYGVVRFFIEYVREPDIGIGFVIRLSNIPNPPERFVTFWNFTMGQILCLLMIIGGIILWAVCAHLFRMRPKVETFTK